MRPDYPRLNSSIKERAIGRNGWLLRAVVAGAILFTVTGCLFDRLFEVKAQACEFDQNFEFQFGESLAVHFKKPILLESDIVLILGAEPTLREETQDRLLLTYQIEESVPEPDPDLDVHIGFDFSPADGAYRLSSILLDSNFGLIFNADHLDHATLHESAKTACEAVLGPGMTSFEVDISDVDLDWLPSKAEIFQLAGKPHAAGESPDNWTYRFRLKGSQNKGDVRFTVWFDEKDQAPVKLATQYARYRSTADLEARVISMNIDLFR